MFAEIRVVRLRGGGCLQNPGQYQHFGEGRRSGEGLRIELLPDSHLLVPNIPRSQNILRAGNKYRCGEGGWGGPALSGEAAAAAPGGNPARLTDRVVLTGTCHPATNWGTRQTSSSSLNCERVNSH